MSTIKPNVWSKPPPSVYKANFKPAPAASVRTVYKKKVRKSPCLSPILSEDSEDDGLQELGQNAVYKSS